MTELWAYATAQGMALHEAHDGPTTNEPTLRWVGASLRAYDPFPMPPNHEHSWFYEGTIELTDRELTRWPIEMHCKFCSAWAWFDIGKREQS